MSLTTPDTTPSPKPTRLRCPNCKISYFNDPIDRDAHQRDCPTLLKRRIKNLETKVKQLTTTIDALTAAPPEFDLDSVADDSTPADPEPEDAPDDEADVDDSGTATQFTAVPRPAAGVATAADFYAAPAIDRDDTYDPFTTGPTL